MKPKKAFMAVGFSFTFCVSHDWGGGDDFLLSVEGSEVAEEVDFGGCGWVDSRARWRVDGGSRMVECRNLCAKSERATIGVMFYNEKHKVYGGRENCEWSLLWKLLDSGLSSSQKRWSGNDVPGSRSSPIMFSGRLAVLASLRKTTLKTRR